MAKDQNTRNPKPNEVVGSKDLRDTFKDGNIRGSFFINEIELHQFSANSPGSVVSQINAKTGAHFVTAEIDDGGHLVLIDNSGADIAIRAGEPYHDAGPASTGDVAKDVMSHLKAAAKDSQKKDDDKDKNNVLEMLGLEATAGKTSDAKAPAPGFETGRSADDRRKAYEDSLKPADQKTTESTGPASSGVDKRGAPQIPSNPTPGISSGAGGKLDDGRGRSGTGGGSGESSTGGIGHRGQPANAPGSAL